MQNIQAIDVLSRISEHTGGLLRDALWLRHIRYNEEHYGFEKTLRGIRHDGEKIVVIGMNHTFKQYGLADLRKVMESGVTTIACDIALPLLNELGTPPTFSLSVDSHPVVANFYRRSQEILRFVTPLLSTTIHRDVVEECRKAGAQVRWVQGFFKEPPNVFHRPAVTSVVSGGNVATMCFVTAAMAFKCRLIGLLGIECAWSDETPYYTLQNFNEIMRMAGINPRRAIKRFRRIHNRHDGESYVVDWTYYMYRRMFRELWRKLPIDVRRSTFNLTREGILSAKGLKQINVQSFLDMNA